MNITTLRLPSRRVETPDLSALEIQSYGADNLYPQRLSDVLSASLTGVGCLNRYIKFIRGNGLEDTVTGATIINHTGETIDDILFLTAEDIARYGGFAWHIIYNAMAEVAGIRVIPFEWVRLHSADERGVISSVAVFDNWDGSRRKGGKSYRASKKTVKYLPVFTPDRDKVWEEIKSAGGVNYYTGQVLYVSSAGYLTYPLPRYDAAITDLSTDEGLANVKYRNVRCNFLPSGMLLSQKGDDADDDTLSMSLTAFQGDVNVGKLMHITYDNEESKPSFMPLDVKNYDKEFSYTEESTIARIYSAFDQEIFFRIRSGSVGFSTEMMTDAFNYYNACTTDERGMMVRALKKVLKTYVTPVNLDLIKIKLLKYDGNANI